MRVWLYNEPDTSYIAVSDGFVEIRDGQGQAACFYLWTKDDRAAIVTLIGGLVKAVEDYDRGQNDQM